MQENDNCTFYPSALESKDMQPQHLSLLHKLSTFASLTQMVQMNRGLKHFQVSETRHIQINGLTQNKANTS